MRRIFSLVLMLLLVLRGLVGTAMAAEMVPVLPVAGPAQPTSLVQQHQTHILERPVATPGTEVALHPVPATDLGTGAHGSGMHTPCANAATSAVSACDGTPSHPHSPLCSACEICHSVLLLPPAPAHISPHAGAVQARPGFSARFASAAAALAIKPPIA